jgi:hypothetical protein
MRRRVGVAGSWMRTMGMMMGMMMGVMMVMMMLKRDR